MATFKANSAVDLGALDELGFLIDYTDHPPLVTSNEITIAVTTDPYVSQPNAFSNGTTEIVNRTSVEVKEESTELKKVSGGATVADLLTNLKALGMKPSQLVSVFVALDKHGFLHADLEVR